MILILIQNNDTMMTMSLTALANEVSNQISSLLNFIKTYKFKSRPTV